MKTHDNTREDKTRGDKTRQDKTRKENEENEGCFDFEETKKMNGHYVSPTSSLDSLFLFSLAHYLKFSLSNTYHYFVPIGGFFLVICVF
jgi:hypothetical protein